MKKKLEKSSRDENTEEHTDSEEEADPQKREAASLDIQRGIERRLQHLDSHGSHRWGPEAPPVARTARTPPSKGGLSPCQSSYRSSIVRSALATSRSQPGRG